MIAWIYEIMLVRKPLGKPGIVPKSERIALTTMKTRFKSADTIIF